MIPNQRPSFILTLKLPVSHRNPFFNPKKIRQAYQEANHSLAEVLKLARKEKCLGQKEAARAIYVDEDTYRFWETGRSLPRPEVSDKIKEFIGKHTALLQNRFIELKERVWTAKQACQLLSVNRHTFESWMGKYRKFKPHYSSNGRRQVFTEADIKELKAMMQKISMKTKNKGSFN